MENLEQLSVVQMLGIQWVMNLIRYLSIAGGTYLIVWKVLAPRLKKYRHNKGKIKISDVKRELFYSLLSTTLFLIPSLAVIFFGKEGVFKVYYDISDHSLIWYATSFVISFLVHDTYFYWLHRTLHTKWLYKRFHSIHHKSIYPTPLAAFAFNASEAILESCFFPIILFFLPIHYSVIMIFAAFSLIMNAYGHLGHDVLPEQIQDGPVLKHINHPTHHGWHHRHHRGNYGFYLKWWDKAMGTYKGGLKVTGRQ